MNAPHLAAVPWSRLIAIRTCCGAALLWVSLQTGAAAQEPTASLDTRSLGAEDRIVFSDLKDLLKRSELVLIGWVSEQRVGRNAPQSTHRHQWVRVQEALVGSIAAGQTVEILEPLEGFPAQAAAQTEIRRIGETQPFLDGGKYVLFLHRRPGSSGQYVLVGGARGRFELDFASNRVLPGTLSPRHPLVQKYAGMTVTDFLLALHRVVDGWAIQPPQ